MNHSNANRFQDFFEESKYTLLKNYLYNYRLRKMAVEKSLQNENIKLILEVGSGIPFLELSEFTIFFIFRQDLPSRRAGRINWIFISALP